MRKKTEADIYRLRNEQDGFSVTEDFMAEFCKFIIEHYLRKFYCFYLHLTCLTTFFTYIQPTLSWNKRMEKGLLGCKT